MFEFIQAILHLDVTINIWAQNWGSLIYLILFLIIFCETGLVVTPFLPGDSLLFAVGAFAATKDSIDIRLIIPLLIMAAVIGDSLNFFIGQKLGRKLFEKDSFFFKKKYLMKTEEFFAKHGNKAVLFARFFPILRTFAPFVAGLGKMNYRVFVSKSFVGSTLWISLFSLTGYLCGKIPFIQKNFTTFVMVLLILPALPIGIAYLKSDRVKRQKN